MALKRVALVTGGNRGIGLEVCRQLALQGYRVLMGARNLDQGKRSAALVEGDVTAVELDVTSEEQIKRLAQEISTPHVLVNNAGIFLDDDRTPLAQASLETLRRTFEVNTLSAFRLCQAFVPGMVQAGYGRVVNVSSGMGQLSEMNGGYPAYRISKTALNAVTRIFADETQGSGVTVNSVCPGWVRTDMGGPGAELPVEEGADTIVWLATHPEGGPSGGFFRQREAIDW